MARIVFPNVYKKIVSYEGQLKSLSKQWGLFVIEVCAGGTMAYLYAWEERILAKVFLFLCPFLLCDPTLFIIGDGRNLKIVSLIGLVVYGLKAV